MGSFIGHVTNNIANQAMIDLSLVSPFIGESSVVLFFHVIADVDLCVFLSRSEGLLGIYANSKGLAMELLWSFSPSLKKKKSCPRWDTNPQRSWQSGNA